MKKPTSGSCRRRLIDHTHYINYYGEDMPAIRNWRWNSPR